MQEVINREALKAIIRDLLPEMLPEIRRALDEITPPTPADKRLLTVDDVHGMTGWHRNHIYRLVKQGRLQKIPNMGREVLFTEESIEGLRENGLG